MVRGWRKWWGRSAPVVVLALGVGVVWLLLATRPEAPERSVAEPYWVVETQTVEPGLHAPLLQLFGYLESPRAATLRAAVSADVDEVAARDGQVVEAGALLLRLDAGEHEETLRQRQAELAEREAALAQERRAVSADEADLEVERALLAIAERRVARLEQLLADEAASPADLDEAQEAKERQRQSVIRAEQAVDDGETRIELATARRDAAAAARDRAQRDVARTEITAPFRGRINEVAVAPGDRVSAGEALIALYDTSALEVRAQLPAPRIATLRRAAAAGLTVAGSAQIDGEALPVTLDRLSGHSPREQGGVEALFRFEGVHDQLALGRFALVELRLPAEPESFVVPYEALYGVDRIYRVDEQERLRAVAVQRLGEARGRDGQGRGVLVRAPELAAGAQIVTTQIPQAADGLRVRVRDAVGAE
ncbi:hypothetical protein CKO15_07525 [Halorhodospira abdelmalekii]|uniref:efflux RND transporter periplasmic adaptor subunit n=1 Tax=Halorhodospira abdelmalekii TaxID=421629 RepID=UPI001905118A|nr:HlyD family efflux transporter periplasmic adaptor subunit [Halorhodospira abdelmalekii]MBK1735138.1 hypothetical protein [Halorhodospira abdelmalekii]